VGEPEDVDELPEPLRSLDRVEVLSLEVFDQCELELGPLVEMTDDRRDPIEAGLGRRADPPLTGHQLIAVDGLGHEDRLQHAVLADARGQGRELSWVETPARLIRVRPDAGDGDLDCTALADRALGDQCGKTTAQALSALGTNGHDSATRSGVRSIGIPTMAPLFRRAFRARNSCARVA
jgi:hypothetical protein